MIKLTLEIDGNEFVYETNDASLEGILDAIDDTTYENLESAESAESLSWLCDKTGLDYDEVLKRLAHLPEHHLNAII